MISKRNRELIALARRYGYEAIGATRKGHIKFRHHTTQRVVVASGTPSDPRSDKNFLSQLQRSSRKVAS